MLPGEATEPEGAYWAARDETQVIAYDIGGPEEGDGVIPCPALIDVDNGRIHVRWDLNELELAALAQGGSLWLTTFGQLPIHLLEVIPKEAIDG